MQRSIDAKGRARGARLGLCLLAAGALAGCGGSSTSLPTATLMLDFTPNGVHAGIYSAVHRHFDRAAGVHIEVEQPSASTDSVKLLLAGRVDFAVVDIHDLAIADAEGDGLIGVMPIVERPLAAVIAQPGISSPRDLDGQTVGVTGVSSDEAVLDSVVAGAGGDPKSLHRVNIGFQAVPSMLAHRVTAVTAFWDVEGVALTHQLPGTREFRVDEYGAPEYPELVVCVTRSELLEHRALVRRVVSAIRRGYQLTAADPQASVKDMLAEVPGLDGSALQQQLAVLHGAFVGPKGAIGEFDRSELHKWARWEARFGIVPKPPLVSEMFDALVADQPLAQ
jgi:ABC-type nitrate/sulfonate/bicarbonate transport system substrate-binding protein